MQRNFVDTNFALQGLLCLICPACRAIWFPGLWYLIGMNIAKIYR